MHRHSHTGAFRSAQPERERHDLYRSECHCEGAQCMLFFNGNYIDLRLLLLLDVDENI